MKAPGQEQQKLVVALDALKIYSVFRLVLMLGWKQEGFSLL